MSFIAYNCMTTNYMVGKNEGRLVYAKTYILKAEQK